MKFANFLKIFLKILVKIQLKKVIIYKSILENSKKDEPLKANFASFANALCHFNATPLSVAVLAPCAWGENLACGVAWQSVVNSATHNTAWRGEFGNETAQRGKIQWHCKFSTGTMEQCLQAKRAKRKWGSVWAGDFSLSLSLSR